MENLLILVILMPANENKGTLECNVFVQLETLHFFGVEVQKELGRYHCVQVDEVVGRFSTQDQTAVILGEQMNKAENDVRELGEKKETLQEEWEVVRCG